MACEEEGRMESICKAAIKLGANDAKLIRAEDVVTGHWVRLKCIYGCDDYGRNLACPPHSPTPDETREILKEYTWALLIKMTPPDLGSYSVYTHELIFKIEREAFLMGYYKAFGFASGYCPYCEECNLKTCAHPEKRRPSMEACGIDVFETARKAGYNMGVYKERDAKPSFFGLLLVV
ncbi:MAG: DUF2284 domain-containing protein [Candidatus Verstraetearchaeota archaeon]|nr:DUF2284 domain-containing protein [Candidatus Verstraetearchaeota archaeon]